MIELIDFSQIKILYFDFCDGKETIKSIGQIT